MGFLKGTLTFTRYRIVGELPDNSSHFIDERIKRFAFRGMTGTEEEKSMGWTSLENVLDTEFQYANHLIGEYITFSLRIDRRTIPSSLLKLKTMEAERKYMEEKSRDRLYKAERNDIRDTIRLSLMRQTPPVPSFFEVCWMPSHQSLFFGSHNEKILEDFEELFKRSFDVRPVAFIPWDPSILNQEMVDALLRLSGEGSR